jgi:TPR repeat protein
MSNNSTDNALDNLVNLVIEQKDNCNSLAKKVTAKNNINFKNEYEQYLVNLITNIIETSDNVAMEQLLDNVNYYKEHAYIFKYLMKNEFDDDPFVLEYRGYCFCSNLGTGVKDVLLGIELYERAFKLGNNHALINMGIQYEAIDEKKAFEYYEIAHSLNITDALAYLGSCYEVGTGVEINPEKAIAYYEEGCLLNNAQALIFLADCYRDGECVEKDLIKAAKLYEQATEFNHIYASYDLALCYYYGYGVAIDKNKAFQILEKSANFGNQDAMLKMAECYELGIGTAKNNLLALIMYIKHYKYGRESKTLDLIKKLISQNPLLIVRLYDYKENEYFKLS